MPPSLPRTLIIIADDFGIGPATSAGILDLAQRKIVTGSVLLVNSPHAASAVRVWRDQGKPMELGWHPNLTLDAPILPARGVPSLVQPSGTFWPLGAFLKRWLRGWLNADEIRAELTAQLRHFRELTGQWPDVVNSHQHVALFAPVGPILLDVLAEHGCRPYVRRVCEPWGLIRQVAGARLKRGVLNHLGRRLARTQSARGFPGNDALAGVTDPPWVRRAGFFTHWLTALAAHPGPIVELCCHPGHFDETLVGRDCTAHDGLMQRRVDELGLLGQPGFLPAVYDAGYTLVRPSQVQGIPGTKDRYACVA